MFPNLNLEREIWASGVRFIIGVDEVGRGAIAGPVAVGVAILDVQDPRIGESWPVNLKDSKLLSEKMRNEIVASVSDWVFKSAVGMASAQEIDSKGIVAALALAAGRALDQLLSDATLRQQITLDGARIILDGSHNWLGSKVSDIAVMVKTKADRDCVSVAAASVIAKVERDNLMIQLAKSFPLFGFESHKGYASEAHIAAVRSIGPSIEHRHTWLTKILGDAQLFCEE